MKIKVTAEHIVCGERGDAWNCPIARAMREIDPDAIMGWSGYMFKGHYHTFSQALRDFVEAFDDGREVAPTEFDV